MSQFDIELGLVQRAYLVEAEGRLICEWCVEDEHQGVFVRQARWEEVMALGGICRFCGGVVGYFATRGLRELG